MAYLETEIDGELRRFEIPADAALRIGRSGTSNIVFNDESVSRRHALLQRAGDGQYYISDLGSSNGTYVNRKRISVPAILQPADSISIGSHKLIFCDAPTGEVRAATIERRTTTLSFKPKLVTVMVADIRDFTALSQRVEPSELSLITGSLFRQAGKVLEERGTWGQKYIGDAVMAIWEHESHEPTASELLSIFEALSQLVTITASLQSTLGLDAPIRLGVGINTGWASLGNVGSTASADHTALGEMVNQAFRLESATKELACDLALGQGTYDLLATDARQIFTACSVRLKGYEHPMTAFTAPLTSLPALLDSL
jgi:adenylate cyclase